jgi:ABC-type Fe3+/spermidine/putrescine transport system ATPase subunit
MQNVSINGLAKRFQDVVAVDHIFLQVDRGEMVTLLGPSGCGKTTTLNMIAGFETPNAGEIYVGDRLISSHETGVFLPPHRRNLGMVFQSYGLWPHMTVADNVGYGLKLRGVRGNAAVERVREALRLVRLEDYAERFPSQLSGGQQQRVSFARAIVYRPDILLLDEPLSNLDAALREEMRLELKELQEQTGITTIFVTHDQMEAMVMSDRVVVMNRGRIEQIGTPEEIYEHPTTRFVAGFIGVTNFLEGRLVESGNNATRVDVDGLMVTCAEPAPAAAGEAVTLSVRPHDWRVSDTPPAEAPANLFASTVEKVVYMGGAREFWAHRQGRRYRIHSHAGVEVKHGDTLYHWVEPERIRLVAA